MNGREKLTYYNGIMWRTVISEGRTRVSQPRRWDANGGVPAPKLTARHRMSGAAR